MFMHHIQHFLTIDMAQPNFLLLSIKLKLFNDYFDFGPLGQISTVVRTEFFSITHSDPFSDDELVQRELVQNLFIALGSLDDFLDDNLLFLLLAEFGVLEIDWFLYLGGWGAEILFLVFFLELVELESGVELVLV
jgi:hypothetical protein